MHCVRSDRALTLGCDENQNCYCSHLWRGFCILMKKLHFKPLFNDLEWRIAGKCNKVQYLFYPFISYHEAEMFNVVYRARIGKNHIMIFCSNFVPINSTVKPNFCIESSLCQFSSRYGLNSLLLFRQALASKG
jgi:hypothetical protein